MVTRAADSYAEGREILAEDITESDLNNYIHAANHHISNLDLEIRSTLHQITGERVYALVNATSDAATQLATAFTPEEMGFVKRVLDSIFVGHNTSRIEAVAVPGLHLIKLHNKTAAGQRIGTGGATQQNGGTGETQGSGGPAITVAQAQKVLDSLIAQGWLEKSKAGFYTLSPRGLMELRGWLMDTYNEDSDAEAEEGRRLNPTKIKVCYACKDIVTIGQRCSRQKCGVRFHDRCIRTQKVRKCPVCKTTWEGDYLVGEKAIPTGKDNSARTSGAGRGSQAAVGTEDIREADHDIDEDEDEEE